MIGSDEWVKNILPHFPATNLVNTVFISPKTSLAFVCSIAIVLMLLFGDTNFNHFLRLYTVAASNSILLAAFIPLAFSLLMPVKFISVPHTGSTGLLRLRFITFAFT